MLAKRAAEVDVHVTDDVRNFLLESPPATLRLDLVTLNIQRGRDHALATYNDMCVAYGLPRIYSFSKVTSDRALARKLRALYKKVDNLDAWVGGLAEDHVKGGSLGPLFHASWVEQFCRLRDGDRFYFRRPYTFTQMELRWLPTVRFLTSENFKGGAM
eukprot:IDg4763t1